MSQSTSNDSKYRLSKTIISKTPISLTSNILNSQTNEVWRAKVFDLEKVDSFEMMDVLQYNEEVFHFLKDNYENSLYLERCFTKNNKDYLVFQPWEIRLSDYLRQNSNGLKNKQQVRVILQEVLLSICDIYAEDFMIINLKPQNIVKISTPNENEQGWRIQSLVFEYKTYNLPEKCEYEFDYYWASNEEKFERQNLDENMKDEQIVWYMGIMALRLIYGQKFKLNQKFKDSDLDLNEIKQKCFPEVFELIQKCVKANLNDRIPLKSMFQLKIFNEVQVSFEIKQKFRSGHEMRIKKSVMIKSSVIQKSFVKKNDLKTSLMKKTSPIKQMPNSFALSEIKAQRMFHQFRWILEKCFYLAQIKDYTQTAVGIQGSKEDKTVIRYLYFKLAENNLSKFTQFLQNSKELQTFRQSSTSKEFYKQLLNCIRNNEINTSKKAVVLESIEYEKKMKILDPKNLKLLSSLQSTVFHLKKNIENSKVDMEMISQCFSQVIVSYMKVNGKYFSTLKKYIQNSQTGKIQNRGIKIRALCFFIFSSYLIQISPTTKESQNLLKQILSSDFELYRKEHLCDQKLLASIHVRFEDEVEFIRLCEYTSQGKEQTLVANAQFLLNKYFKTVDTENRNIEEIGPIKQNQKSNNWSFPSRNKY